MSTPPLPPANIPGGIVGLTFQDLPPAAPTGDFRVVLDAHLIDSCDNRIVLGEKKYGGAPLLRILGPGPIAVTFQFLKPEPRFILAGIAITTRDDHASSSKTGHETFPWAVIKRTPIEGELGLGSTLTVWDVVRPGKVRYSYVLLFQDTVNGQIGRCDPGIDNDILHQDE